MSSPFGVTPVDEVPLPRAPLSVVLAQVRFPALTTLAVDDNAAKQIAARLAPSYPLLNENQEMMITITPDGVNQQPTRQRTWQLQDKSQRWHISFGREFVALYTSAYTTRDAFIERLGTVVDTFREVLDPPSVERVGVRYINRLDRPADLADLSKLVRPEVLGGLAVPTAGSAVAVARTLSETLLTFNSSQSGNDDDGLQVRWGQLPPGAILDQTMPPVSTVSWVLDLDAFQVHRERTDFSTRTITSEAQHLAERAYRFFRWAVTNEFLARFGGKQ